MNATENNAIEIRNLTKRFGDKIVVNGLNMTVPKGAIYGFIGENGSGKSTTEKTICGLLRPSGGEITLLGKNYTDGEARSKIGVLIETPGCFSGLSVWNNLMIQAANLSIPSAENEVRRVLKLVRMEGAAGNKYKNCSLGMKQRIGIAMALMGDPKLLILDEPINGLDADGMRIMREILSELVAEHDCTVVISSHVLSELEKIATHYGIIRGGRMIKEMTAAELESDCRTYFSVRAADIESAENALRRKYTRVETDDTGAVRVYDADEPEEIVTYLYENGITISEIGEAKISLEEYYIDLMHGKENK